MCSFVDNYDSFDKPAAVKREEIPESGHEVNSNDFPDFSICLSIRRKSNKLTTE